MLGSLNTDLIITFALSAMIIAAILGLIGTAEKARREKLRRTGLRQDLI
jgi:hypothetical protein